MRWPITAGPQLTGDHNMKSETRLQQDNEPSYEAPAGEFMMWPDGPVRAIYDTVRLERARRHVSGWAMRNTNNHNRDILKKSCLGVLACSRADCLAGTVLRPAICDKARRRQQLHQRCPQCGSGLDLRPCRGNSGYPVTHFWRQLAQGSVLFLAKGIHDHLRPETRATRESGQSSVTKKRQSKSSSKAVSTTPQSPDSSEFFYPSNYSCPSSYPDPVLVGPAYSIPSCPSSYYPESTFKYPAPSNHPLYYPCHIAPSCWPHPFGSQYSPPPAPPLYMGHHLNHADIRASQHNINQLQYPMNFEQFRQNLYSSFS